MADRSVVYRLRADVTQFRAQMASAAASTKDAADKMTAGTKEGAKFRDGLNTLGVTAGKVGLVAAAGLGAAVIKAANFDQAMSSVQAATRESAAGMDALRDAALKAGAETVFSATEAAQGIEELAKAGVSTADILGGGLNGALDLAAAGQIGVGEAAEYAAQAMTQFSLSGDQVPHVADLLAAAAGKAVGEVGDFGQALNQVGLVASQTGLSIEDTVGTLAAFAQAGLSGSDAGTSFKSMLQRLQNPLGQGAKAMESLGINAYDAEGNFVGITSVAGQLQDKLGGLTQAQRDAALAQIFGSDAVRAASILYREGADGIQNWINQTNDTGFAAETAATKLDNLKGDLEALGGALETALIGTGSGTQGPLRGLVQSLTDVVNAYNKLPEAAQSGVGAILGVTAAAGGGLFAFSKIVQGVANTREAMSNLGLSMDSVRSKAGTTGASLGTIATSAAGIAGAVILVNQLTDSLNRIDASKIERGLEALTRGESTDDIDQLVFSLANLETGMGGVNTAVGKITSLGGLLGDSQFDKYAENVEQVDQALASMVESGNVDQAQESFKAIADAAAEQGVSLSAVEDRFTEYATALDNAEGRTNVFASAFGGLASIFGETEGSTNQLTAAYEDNAKAAAENAKAQREIRAGASEVAAGFLDISAGANDANVSLSQWIQNMAAQATALRDFTANAEAAANRGLRDGVIKQLRALGPEGALRLAQLGDASKSSQADIEALNRAFGSRAGARREYLDSVQGITEKLRAFPEAVVTDFRQNGVPKSARAIVDLTKKYNLTPRQVRTLIKESGAKLTQRQIDNVIKVAKELDRQRMNPQVKVDGAQAAISAAGSVRAALNNIPLFKLITIRTQRTGGGQGGGGRTADALGGIHMGGHRVFAMGGFGDKAEHHQPELYRGGVTRVWGEPETKGEAYIPLANDYRRPRAQAIAAETVALLGGVAQFADGGVRGGSRMAWVGPDGRTAARGLQGLAEALERSKKALEREKKSRDDLVSARGALKSSVSSAFLGDPFEVSNVWAAGAGDPRGMLRQQIAQANAQKKLLASLKKAGLDGQAFASVADDPRKAQALKAMGTAGIREYESLFNQRARAAAAVGTYAGAAVYNAGIKQDDRQIKGLRGDVRRLTRDLKQAQARAERARKGAAKKTGREVAKGVNKGVTAKKRKKRAGG